MSVLAHGTRRTYQLGCACVGCRAAEAIYRQHLRGQHVRGQIPAGTKVSAIVAWRQMRQLEREEVTPRDLARRLGYQTPIQFGRRRMTLQNVLKVQCLFQWLMGEDLDHGD